MKARKTRSALKTSWKRAHYNDLRVSSQDNTKMGTLWSRVLLEKLIVN